MNTIISPSSLALAATGLAPAGSSVCKEAGLVCAVCGVPIEVGQPMDDLALPDSFTNYSSLAHPGGAHRCGACTAVMGRKEFQVGMATGIFSSEGWFPIMLKEHRSWAFLTPPEPPFAICIQTGKQQHVVWRAPISTSRDIIFVRVGELVVRIRRPALLAARDAAIFLNAKRAEMVVDNGKSRGRPSTSALENPFFHGWKLDAVGGGTRKFWVDKLLDGGFIGETDLSPLNCLSPAESWAVGATLAAPVKPQAIKF